MVCDPAKAGIWPEKDPQAKLDYYVSFERECTRYWTPNTDFASSVRIRPNKHTGFEYASSGGRSGAREGFGWPTTLGQTVVDGSITWTCQTLSAASFKKTISGVPVWSTDS